MPSPRSKGDVAGVRSDTSLAADGKAGVGDPIRLPESDRLFDAAADAILVLDSTGRYVRANQAACQLTGYSIDELTKMKVGDLTVPTEREGAAQRFGQLCRDGRILGDRLVLRKDGTAVRVEVNAAAVGDGTYQAILRDISDRVASEEALRGALQAYSTLVDLCHAAVVSAGSDGRIRSWNPGAEALFGYRHAEALGMPVSALISTRQRDQHVEAFRRQTESKTVEPFRRIMTVDALRKDGSEFPVEVSVAVGGTGPDRMYTAVIRDMSEHRAVVEQLNETLHRFRSHIQRMPLAYVVWDTDFRVVEWNPAAERMFGYSRAEAMGRRAYELIVPPEAQPVVDKVWADLLQGDTSSHSINANVRKDGSQLMCEWFNTPLRDPTGRIRGVASMTRDVTEHEAMEARLRDAQKLESLGVLAGGVAHDFNSSLMVILGNAALLRSVKGIPARALEHVELIEEAGSRASQLIKHLLAYARTGRHNPQPTDLNALLQESIAFLQSSIGKAYEIEQRLAKRLDPILADRSQLEQVILNLCLNAKQAMPKQGTITISTKRKALTAQEIASCVPSDIAPGDFVELCVTDTGLGMDAVTKARIFDPFFTTKPDGHGLGLAGVLGILRQHHGAVWVESEPGKGTRMHVFFPVHPPNNPGRRA